MADYIYLLETRLTPPQQAALGAVREIARSRGLTVFLVGGAVRDLISGAAVRDLDVVVQGSAAKLRKDLEKAGAVLTGEADLWQSLFLRFPGGVRMEIGPTVTITYPRPARPVVKPASILDDLRRRDFTANAMALSLNEGSYGLLMDPLNGVADIENRELRLVSNYGFIEDPVRLIRAARLMARLGWNLEEKTRERYETGKSEGYISGLSDFLRGYETEELFYEEDPLRIMRRLEEDGWLQQLSPALSSAKGNVPEMERLAESHAQLQIQGILASTAAANFPLVTAKLQPTETATILHSFPRQGFVEEIQNLEARGREFASRLGSKAAAQPSQAYQMIVAGDPEAVLWAAFASKSGAVAAKFKSFYTDWPSARQRIPHVLMQEMRITPDLPEYDELQNRLFFELMDGRLGTPEEMKAFLEPYSPPAPPPPVSLRRARAAKKAAKPAKGRKKQGDASDESSAESSVAVSAEKEPISPEGEEEAAPATELSPETKPKLTKKEPEKALEPTASELPRDGAKRPSSAPAKPAAPASPAKVSVQPPAKKAPAPAAAKHAADSKSSAGKNGANKPAAPAAKSAKASPPRKAGTSKRPTPTKPQRRSTAKPVAKKAAPKPVAKKPAPKAPAKKVAGKAAAKKRR